MGDSRWCEKNMTWRAFLPVYLEFCSKDYQEKQESLSNNKNGNKVPFLDIKWCVVSQINIIFFLFLVFSRVPFAPIILSEEGRDTT